MIREVHFARVLDNNDPAKRGGIKVRCDTLFDGGVLQEEFIPPSWPFAGKNQGFFFVPDEGAQVEIEVVAGNEAQLDDLGARYRSVLYSELDEAPDEFTSDPSKRAGIKYGDHVLIFDKAADIFALVSNNLRLGEEDASHELIRGDTYNGQEQTFVSAEDALLSVLLTAWTAFAALTTGPLAPIGAIAAPVPPAITTYKAALAVFKTAKDTWLSTKVKTE